MTILRRFNRIDWRAEAALSKRSLAVTRTLTVTVPSEPSALIARYALRGIASRSVVSPDRSEAPALTELETPCDALGGQRDDALGQDAACLVGAREPDLDGLLPA